MELKTLWETSDSYLGASGEVILAEKEKFKIKAPADETLLEATVPNNKQWTVKISIEVIEKDAPQV